MVSRYQKRISGPLLDRIDIHIDVPRVEYEKQSDERLGESSSSIILTNSNAVLNQHSVAPDLGCRTGSELPLND
jgi:predicted ATPase with chaperone activity